MSLMCNISRIYYQSHCQIGDIDNISNQESRFYANTNSASSIAANGSSFLLFSSHELEVCGFFALKYMPQSLHLWTSWTFPCHFKFFVKLNCLSQTSQTLSTCCCMTSSACVSSKGENLASLCNTCGTQNCWSHLQHVVSSCGHSSGICSSFYNRKFPIHNMLTVCCLLLWLSNLVPVKHRFPQM